MANPHPTTAALEQLAAHWRETPLTPAVVTAAKTCITDWLAVTIGGVETPIGEILLREAQDERSAGRASIVGLPGTWGARQAAEINGVLGHALDYDDVHLAAVAHVTAAVLPAALACVQQRNGNGEQLLRAFIAGTEATLVLGLAMGPEHYACGFHATGTLGTIGAAVAGAIAYDLQGDALRNALGLAATRAAGLKASFGTMAKPLHAGHAAALGVSSARLAAAGFTAHQYGLDVPQGFIATHTGATSAPVPFPPAGPHILSTLFKFNAACYGTHATIEAIRKLVKQHGLTPADVEKITLHVDTTMEAMCNQRSPQTGLNAKFSLAFNAALALYGIDTAATATYSDELAQRKDLQAMSDQVEIHFGPGRPQMSCSAEVMLKNGKTLRADHDAGVPETDLDRQAARINEKFASLVTPILGQAVCSELLQRLGKLETLASVSELTSGTQRA